MAQPPALIVRKVERGHRGHPFDAVTLHVTTDDGTHDTIALGYANRGTLVRAAMNCGITADTPITRDGVTFTPKGWHEWTDAEKVSGITQTVWADTWTGGNEFTPTPRSQRPAPVPAPDTLPLPNDGTLFGTTPAPVTSDATAAALAALMATLTPAAATVDAETVRVIVAEAMAAELDAKLTEAVKHLAPQVTRVTLDGITLRDIEGRQHAVVPEVVALLAAGMNAFVYGPAGSGKTTAARHAAAILGVEFTTISGTPDMGRHDLLGYMDMRGQYVSTPFRDAYETGKAFLFDEVDNASSEVLAGLNEALANGHCTFPDARVTRHPNFYAIAGGNTAGTGPTSSFAGRVALDKATLDRFERLWMPYDLAVEWDMINAVWADTRAASAWHERVQTWRTNADAHRIESVSLSPRRVQSFARLRAIGWTEERAEKVAIWAETPAEIVAKIKGSK
jgi:cobaltochelatase CobS